MNRFVYGLLLTVLFTVPAAAQDSVILRRIADDIMLNGTCYDHLRILCKQIGHRLSGTAQAQRAVEWGLNVMKASGADTVWLQPVEVPHWHRGKESLHIRFSNASQYEPIPVLSLGNSTGTGGTLLTAPVIMVHNIAALSALPDKAVEGKIVFFNLHFPQEKINTFEGYGHTARYRSIAPNVAASKGATAVIIRSISTGLDDIPHTGMMSYADSVKPIPATAIGNFSADRLAQACASGEVMAQLQSECTMKEPVLSYNVIGELRGSTYPEEIVLAGGHLDSWDVGEGAHDDGAGCVQSMEIIRTFRALGLTPKRTIRAVLFMNEENGVKGGLAYADSAKAHGEQHIFAMESDAGGFSPRGISLQMKEEERALIQRYAPLFLPYGIYDFDKRFGGVDITPLHRQGVPAAGLLPDPQRYFDLHHTAADVFEAVSHRELKLGAVTMTQMIYLMSEYGWQGR